MYPNSLNNVNRASKALKSSVAPIAIQKLEAIDETTARALVSFVGDFNEKSLSESVAVAFSAGEDEGAKVRLARGSAFAIGKESNGALLVDLVLKRNQVTKPYAEAEVAGMSVIAENIFADKADMIWNLISEGDTRVLVQSTAEDLNDILGARRSMSVATASVGYELEEAFSYGDGLLVYDAAKEQHIVCIAMNETTAYNLADDTMVEIAAAEVVVNEGNALQRMPEYAAINRVGLNSENMLERYLEYFRGLYKNHPSYFKRMESVVRNAFERRAVNG